MKIILNIVCVIISTLFFSGLFAFLKTSFSDYSSGWDGIGDVLLFLSLGALFGLSISLFAIRKLTKKQIIIVISVLLFLLFSMMYYMSYKKAIMDDSRPIEQIGMFE
jgi:hypothetical protein